MKNIGLLVNYDKSGTDKAAAAFITHAQRLDLNVFAPQEHPVANQPSVRHLPQAEFRQSIDALVSLGGDGSVLRAVHILEGQPIPILGINLGSLGFMTSLSSHELDQALPMLVEKSYTLSERQLLQCSINSQPPTLALNDLAIGWGSSPHIINLSVSINDEEVTTFACDGLIISTPIGSTGHSLSAGGPIIHPEATTLLINPICPHTLSNRPLIVPAQFKIKIRIQESFKELLVAADGQVLGSAKIADAVTVNTAAEKAYFVSPPAHSYFALLRQKLHWRGSSI